MSFEIGTLNHITFAVENMERSIEFYQTVLNAKLLARGDKLAYFDVSGIWIALNLEQDIPSKERQRTYTHIAFTMSENDQEAFIKHLEENEIEYTRGRSRNIREGKSVYVRDYDGHLLEFHSRTRTDRLELYKDERHDIEIL
jgi:metallothiol transferase